jgi:hypothetical protein
MPERFQHNATLMLLVMQPTHPRRLHEAHNVTVSARVTELNET